MVDDYDDDADDDADDDDDHDEDVDYAFYREPSRETSRF